MYILTDPSGKKGKSRQGNRNMTLKIPPGVPWKECESPLKCRLLKHWLLYKPKKVRGTRYTEEVESFAIILLPSLLGISVRF